MAIKIPSGFQITSSEPVDRRLVLTKAEMTTLRDDRMPDLYFTLCSDDSQIYIYNKAKEADTASGKFELISKVQASEIASKIKRINAEASDETSV